MPKDIVPMRLRLRRTELRLSQRALAARSRVNRSKIAQIEAGTNTGRDRETQDALADALGVTVDYLCGADGKTARAPEPAAIVAGQSPPSDLGPLDTALEQAWHPPDHRIVDLLVVRVLVQETGRKDLGVHKARSLLDASARLRARGEAPTSLAVAVEAAGPERADAETPPAKSGTRAKRAAR